MFVTLLLLTAGSVPILTLSALSIRYLRDKGSVAGLGRTFCAVTAFGLLSAIALFALHRHDLDNQARVENIRQRIDELNTALLIVTDAETGQRGFLLTENPRYLEPFLANERRLGLSAAELLRLIGDDHTELARARAFIEVANEKIDELRTTVKLERQGNRAAALALVNTHQGDDLMRRLRSIRATMDAHERHQLVRLHDAVEAARIWGAAAFCMGLMLLTLALLASARSLTRQQRRRQHAELELGEKNRRLNLAETVAHVGHWRVETTTQEVFWSDEVFRIHDLTPAQAAPGLEDAIAFYHPDDRSMVEGCIADSIARREPFDFAARIVGAEGTRDVMVRGGPERRDDASIVLFGTVLDVTQLRKAERAREETEIFLRGIIESSGDCIKVVDLEGNLTFISNNGRCMMEIDDAARVIGRPFAELWPASLEPQVAKLLETALSGKAAQLDAPVLSAKGTPLHLDVLVTLIRNQSGQPQSFVAIARDITHIRRAQNVARESEARYRLLATYASDLILLGHADGRRTYVSPAVKPMLGYEVEEAYTLSMRDVVHPDDLAAVFAATASLTPDRPNVSSLYRLRRKDGVYIWVESAVRRVEDEGDVKIISAIRDVTLRQTQAEQLRIAKERAELASLEAERASRAKTDFLATMSHEIRTPLNSIIGFTEQMLQTQSLSGEARRHAELIQSSGSALLTVVNDVLDFSQIEAGAIKLHLQPFSPRSLADNSVSIIRGAAAAKQLDITLTIDPALPPGLFGDEARLRQVLLNLLNNAVKFTRSGYVALSVKLESTTAMGMRVRFAVVDSGIGIPKAKLGRLFQRFSQVDSSTHRDFGGSGLGLAICKKLIELMNGEIGVFSDVGRGSTFWFTLTLPQAVLGPRPGEGPRAERHKRGHLLLVEDVEVNQKLAVVVLEAVGHSVFVVGDGHAAIAAVQDPARTFDLVLMDIQMPGMDGMSATKAIRALGHPASRLPILAMTANVLPQQVRDIRAAGMDDHVGKPFNRSELYATIDRWLPERDGAPERRGTCEAAASYDRSAFETVVALVGRTPAMELLGSLAQDIGQRFMGETGSSRADRLQLKRDAHAVMPAADMLGYKRLAQLCASIEGEPDPDRVDNLVSALKGVCTAVLADIEAMVAAGAAQDNLVLHAHR